jgi:hypothetical protein
MEPPMVRFAVPLLAVLSPLACATSDHGSGGVHPRTVTEARRLDDKALDEWNRSGNAAVVANGQLTPAPSVMEAAAMLSKMSPRPVHAYVVDASRARSDRWEMVAPYGDVSVIGLDALSEVIDEVTEDPRSHQITFTKDGRSTTLKYVGDVPVIRFRISPASDPSQSRDVNLLVATGFSNGVFLKASDAVNGALETSEEPGETTLSQAGFDAALSCRRALVWIEVPELKSRALVSVAYQDASTSK